MAMRPPPGGGGLLGAMASKIGGGGGPMPGPTPPMGVPGADSGSTPMADEALLQDFLTNSSPAPQDITGAVQALIRKSMADAGPESAPPSPMGGPEAAPGGPLPPLPK